MVRNVHSVVSHLVEVDPADQVVGAHQLFLDVPGEVAGVEKLRF